ncbi:hypothetical protein HMN09_00005900 [Mycena chlorophos]|uniref:Uncharacterized protein n=1 Tax=Mycena chlorophos TaxID=658473 RepID=A0A8H6TV32_MYCCL|nr:hypothetical protein HMN09_00005900 [Mycena chlorophos]
MRCVPRLRDNAAALFVDPSREFHRLVLRHASHVIAGVLSADNGLEYGKRLGQLRDASLEEVVANSQGRGFLSIDTVVAKAPEIQILEASHTNTDFGAGILWNDFLPQPCVFSKFRTSRGENLGGVVYPLHLQARRDEAVCDWSPADDSDCVGPPAEVCLQVVSKVVDFAHPSRRRTLSTSTSLSMTTQQEGILSDWQSESTTKCDILAACPHFHLMGDATRRMRPGCSLRWANLKGAASRMAIEETSDDEALGELEELETLEGLEVLAKDLP